MVSLAYLVLPHTYAFTAQPTNISQTGFLNPFWDATRKYGIPSQVGSDKSRENVITW